MAETGSVAGDKKTKDCSKKKPNCKVMFCESSYLVLSTTID